jgi:ABC-type sugar transport system substrate-binding protein
MTLAACAGSSSGTASGPASPGASSGGDSGVKTVAYANIDLGPVMPRFLGTFQDAAKLHGWKVLTSNANDDNALAAKQIQNFINQGVDALVLGCQTTSAIRAQLNEAKSKGIPVIANICPVAGPLDLYTAVNVEDEAGMARTLGEHIATTYQSAPSKAKCAVMTSDLILNGPIRLAALKDSLKSANVDLVSIKAIPLTSIVPSSTAFVKATLQQYPDLSCVVGIYDFFSPPAVSVIKSAGRDKVKVFGFYADSVNGPLLNQANSPLVAVVDGPAEITSLVTADQLAAHFHGKPINGDQIKSTDIPSKIFTAESGLTFNASYLSPYNRAEISKTWFDKWRQEYNLS